MIFEYLKTNILLDEFTHLWFVLPFALLLWKKTHSREHVLALILATFLIDMDHLVDYFSVFEFGFSFYRFMSGLSFEISHRGFVVFHAWEWIIILGVIAHIRGWKSIFTILFLALLPHVVYDSLGVGSFSFYSIIYRGSHGFALP